MKYLLISFFLILSAHAHNLESPPHLDPQMTSSEYRIHLASAHLIQTKAEPSIEKAIALGERLSKWIALINNSRTPHTAIRLTSPETRHSFPISSPNIYSPEIVEKRTAEILRDLPASMSQVILDQGELPSSPLIDDQTFIKHARLIDRNYQNGARYKSLDYYRSTYTSYAGMDVRGFYFLTTNKITAHELRDVNLIPENMKAPIREALIGICNNDGAPMFSTCEKKVDKAFAENKLADIYNKAYPTALQNWNSFFRIGARRDDVKWTGNTMTVPFNTPSIEKFIPYLQNNIQDEYRFKDWRLMLQFGNFYDGPVLIFRPNVVPHVNKLAGNEITMDSNQPIEEYESQWIIRHEFGHVLGLPDCYHEFYDKKLRAYVNYQLDTTDLMCSRAGNMNERIYNELAKAYKK